MKAGDRVILAPRCQYMATEHMRNRVGTIVGFSRILRECVWVRWDGRKYGDAWHVSFLRREQIK